VSKDKLTNKDVWGGPVPPPGESATSQYARLTQAQQDQTQITPHGHTVTDVHGNAIDAGANLAKVSVQEYLASHPSDPNQRDVTTGYQGYKNGRPLTPAEQVALRNAVAARVAEQQQQPNQPQPQGQPPPQDVHGQTIPSQVDPQTIKNVTVKKPKGKP
jgi:hypothetical protein